MIAVRMTDWENHRTPSEYENSLITKVFCFQYINSYMAVFYELFWTQQIDKAMIQVASVMISKQLMDLVKEQKLPMWKAKRRVDEARKLLDPSLISKGLHAGTLELERVVRNDVLIPSHSTVDEYAEMCIQYGFVAMFACLFPLGPLFAVSKATSTYSARRLLTHLLFRVGISFGFDSREYFHSENGGYNLLEL